MADDAAAPRSGASDHRWQGQGSGPAAAPSGHSRRRSWLIVLGGMVLALVTLVIVWVLFIQPPPPPPFYLMIGIAEYNARQYPVVAFTRQDGERVLRHFPVKTLAETKTKELLRNELKGLAGRSEPLIVHITALALARDEKVLLLPGDADPSDESTWLDVAEILRALSDCPAPHKMLILDLAHAVADPRLGVLTDRVAETLEDQLSREKPAFPVVCACSGGQLALSSELLQSSVFAYYLDQGLQGHADTNQDLRVTVRELFSFLEARVDRWALTNHGVRQKPRWFGPEADFIVIGVGSGSLGELERAELEPYPDRLQKSWQARDAAASREAFRRAPRMLFKLEAALQRQENQWRGGLLQKRDVQARDDELQALTTDLELALGARHTPQRSLALALAQSGTKKDAVLADAVLNILANTMPVGEKKGINTKVEEELLKKLKDQKEASFAQQAGAVMEALPRLPLLRPDHFHVAKAVLADLQPKHQYAELLYVQRVIDYAARKDADAWQAKNIQALLQTILVRENLIAALDREPELLPWLAGTIEETDSLRRVGERKLLWEGASTYPDALDKLQTAKARYEEVLQMFDILQRSRVHLDRAFAELPGFMNLLCDGPEFDSLAEQAWSKAIGEAEKLQASFAAPPQLGATGRAYQEVVKLDTPARDLERHLQSLKKTLQRRMDRAEKEDHAEAQQQLVKLLDSPLLRAPERGAFLARQRVLAVKLHDSTDQQDKEDNRQYRVLAASDPPRNARANAAGLARAKMAAALLRLTDAGKKTLVLPPATGRLSTKDWTILERKLQQAWSKDLVTEWRSAKNAHGADAVNRLVSPWELESRARGVDEDPSVLLQRKLRDAFRQWLQERYQAEATSLAVEPRDRLATIFYTEAAREMSEK